MFVLTTTPERAPDVATYVEIDFQKGNPVAINGVKMSGAKLLHSMNKMAGANGIGRVDMVENRFVGMKSRGVYETPGGTVLWAAHRAVESITMDREVMLMRDSLIPKYAQLVYSGFWYSPEMNVLQKFIDETQENVTGTARLKLYKGNCVVVGRKSPNSLYSEEFVTFEKDRVYDQKDATGFIRLNALRMKIQALIKRGKNKKNLGVGGSASRQLRWSRHSPLRFILINAFIATISRGASPMHRCFPNKELSPRKMKGS